MNALRQNVGMFVHGLTWNGKASAVYYAVRRLFVAPAPTHERCFMGSVVDPMVWCPRRAEGVWCDKHQPEARYEQIGTALYGGKGGDNAWLFCEEGSERGEPVYRKVDDLAEMEQPDGA